MQKNHSGTIVLICFLSLAAIGLLVFMSVFLVNRNQPFFHFNRRTNMEVLEKKKFDSNLIEKISIRVKSSDIHIIEGDTNQVEVKVIGNKKEDYQVEIQNKELRINKRDENYFCFGFCYTDYEVEIKVPKAYSKDMNITTASGSVLIDTNLTSNLDILTISGDVEVKEINNARIKTTSGEIEISKAQNLDLISTSGDIEVGSCKNVEIKTTSGEISIGYLELSKNAKIKTVSGDVEIEKTNDIYIDVKTISGDTEIKNNNRKSPYELLIETTSGDVEVE